MNKLLVANSIANPSVENRTCLSSKPHENFQLRWIECVEELDELRPMWDDLFQSSIWQNVSLAHNFLVPAFEHLNRDGARVLVIESRSVINPSVPVLCGLVPLVKKPIYCLPIPGLETWKHDQCFDSTPLLRKGCAAQVLAFMFEQLAEQGYGLLSLDTVTAEQEFQVALSDALKKTELVRFQRKLISRAAFRPVRMLDEYVTEFVSKSVRRNCRRLARRLADVGNVTFEIANENSDFEELAQSFLNIENTGWKRDSQTALAANAATHSFYRDMISRSASVGKARFLTLRLDGKPVAMLSDLQFDGRIYSYKTAFDEKFSAYSPGLQVELKNIEVMHEQGIELADSCTAPDNAMINKIWGQRLQIQDVVIGLRLGAPMWATRLMPFMQQTANQLTKFHANKN